MLPEGFLIGNVPGVLSGLLRRGIHLAIKWRFWGTKQLTRWKHFQEDEVVGLDPAFVDKLDAARDLAGVSFLITSGKRSPGDNATVGGVQDSAHLEGLAVDLRFTDHHTRGLAVRALYAQGLNRVGIYRDGFGNPTHIHVDASLTLPQDELWDGVSH